MAHKDVVNALLSRYGSTYAKECGITLKDAPASLFQLLVMSTLMSARISSDIAVDAAKSLFHEGWTTPEKMADSTWQERVDALNEAGYARYQERTSEMLGDTVELLLDRWNGDLRELREEADREPDELRKLLKECKGIGDTGVDIFFREAQTVWDELYPFVDGRTTGPAKRLDLPADAEGLADLVSKQEFARLVASLVRVDLEDAYDEIRDEAA